MRLILSLLKTVAFCRRAISSKRGCLHVPGFCDCDRGVDGAGCAGVEDPGRRGRDTGLEGVTACFTALAAGLDVTLTRAEAMAAVVLQIRCRAGLRFSITTATL